VRFDPRFRALRVLHRSPLSRVRDHEGPNIPNYAGERVITSLVNFEYQIHLLFIFLLHRASLLRQPFSPPLPLAHNEPRPVPRGRAAGCSRHQRPPIFRELEIYARLRNCDKSGTLPRTWRPSVESLILRQIGSALPLTFNELRIAGISR